MPNRGRSTIEINSEPLWFKDAIIYQLHVRAFYDSDADGYGDFRGLAQKLDYLQDLGVTAIWLLPFYPSPLRDDGYDIADYKDIHARYGSLRDFRTLLKEAEKRGLKVISELVLNHTSDQHPWFQRARFAKPGTAARDYYVWSDQPGRYADARIIFKDFERSNWTWDHDAGAYFWHRFYSHQPDLNFENAAMRRQLFEILDFWLEMGVAGLRLDAVPYLYEEEGTNCENLPRTHQFLKELRKHVDRKFSDRMLLAEANQWPEDASAYFGAGDECHMAFHFPLMPRMFMAVQLEDRFPIIDILQQTPAIPDNCQWALFLRNHDELTLEMVTDEERDYMYRIYAHDLQARINLGIRRRLAPLLGNNRRKIELMNGLLLSLPGTPIIYYGDEIGMGDNIYLGDRNGVRTPMQWTADRNAGFSAANPQQLYLPVVTDPEYRFEAINVETQNNNPHSLLWWMKRLIGLRKQYKAFTRGTIEFLSPENPKVLCFVRKHETEVILVVANLSRFVQYLELDLSRYEGAVPIEIFGQTDFPRIGKLPYFITLGAHSFYWFSLQPATTESQTLEQEPEKLPLLKTHDRWENIFRSEQRSLLKRVLQSYLRRARWFGGKARKIRGVDLTEAVRLPLEPRGAMLILAQVDYTEGDPETYAVPLTWFEMERAKQIERERAHMLLARLSFTDRAGVEQSGVLGDAFLENPFAASLLTAIERRRRFAGEHGALHALPVGALGRLLEGRPATHFEPHLVKGEQSNTSVIFGDKLILKLFRKIESGVNPDIEITRLLTARKFTHIAPLTGALEYRFGRGETMSIGILQAFVRNEGDAWTYTLDWLRRTFEQILTRRELETPALPAPPSAALSDEKPPAVAGELIGHYLEMSALLGRRTAELHVALASETANSNFTPESFSPHYQRSLYQSMRNLAGGVFALLGKQLARLPESIRPSAREVANRQAEVLNRFRLIVERRITARRIRVHGDYHLGQILFTGMDFVILDFEGEPSRSLSERRIKRSPLRDVAGMLRSFHYAAQMGLANFTREGLTREENRAQFEVWTQFWYRWVARTFLAEYLRAAQPGGFLPKTAAELQTLLDAYVLEKAIYELGYELNNRPDWVQIPINGILDVLNTAVADGVPAGKAST